jgi:hypothetical protein
MSDQLRVDGMPLGRLVPALGQRALTPGQAPTTQQTPDRYWSTPPRALGDPLREVLEIGLNDQRLINYVSVELPRFPHLATLEYRDLDTGAWLPMARSDGPAQASYAVRDSVPPMVGVASAAPGEHPQHRGPGHWLPVSWRVKPALTRAVRLVLTRAVAGDPPVDTSRRPVAYSLGARGLQVGYRINSLADVPRYGDVTTYRDEFATSTDLLGSRVTFSLARAAPSAVLTGNEGDFWRSEPMPVPYAVVNFYVDTRGADGEGQVIDRWYMEPLSVGCHLNLYYSDDEPDGPVPASDQALAYPIVQFHGTSATAQRFPPTTTAEHISFSHVFPSYIDVDNAFVQHDPTRPWWLGVEVASPYHGADGVTEIVGVGPDHPVLSLGASSLRTVPGALEFTTSSGQVLRISLGESHVRGARWRVALSYDGAVLTMTYQVGVEDPVDASLVTGPIARPGVLRLGGYPSTVDPGVPGIVMRALVLKNVAADPSSLADFFADPRGYVSRPPFVDDDDGSTDGAILRLDPPRADPDRSPAGLYGGPGDPYDRLEWTPVLRDYSLRRGYLYLPPTRARRWKFEITSLVAEPYEAFVPIGRQVKLFTTDVVRSFERSRLPTGPPAGGPGTKSSSALGPLVPYYGASALQATGRDPATSHSPTEALVARTPSEAARLTAYGWVWSFQGWHLGSAAPRFVTRTRHVYETVTVQHRTKIAYFAGLRRLQPYRLDYLADDDEEQYRDHLDDLTWVETVEAMRHSQGELLGLSGASSATSKTFASLTPVRALQFATQQSDPMQVLEDDRFLASDFDASWEVYGDAALTPERGRVVVNRGWRPTTWGEVEDENQTYDDLEDRLYAELEGYEPDGTSSGGVQSKPYSPSGGGQLYAAARVTATETTVAPIALQIVSVTTDEVLAESTLPVLLAGEEAVVEATYGIGTGASRLTYGEIEDAGTYEDAEALTYGEHESVAITGDVRARLVQVAPSNDTFSVLRLSLFDDPVEWLFSVDDGADWYAARGVRNNPAGVLTFPEQGTELRWRVRFYRPGASVSAIAMRPWYAGQTGCVAARYGTSVSGPNCAPADHHPPIERDPMWMGWDRPIPRWWYATPASGAPEPGPEPPVAVPSGDTYQPGYPPVYGGVGQVAYADAYIDPYVDQYG